MKALPNPYIMKLLKNEGFGADCSSSRNFCLQKRQVLQARILCSVPMIRLQRNLIKARELSAIINLDDISHIEYLEETAGLPEIVCCRYNPGPLKEGNAIIGNPEEAKYGFTREQLFEGYRTMKEKGVKRFGMHTMVASNELDPAYFIETAKILFELIAEISNELDIRFEFVNLGGGIGIPYRPEQEAVPYDVIAKGVAKAYDEIIKANNLHPLKIFLECGRVITGPYGYLITSVRHLKHIYKDYVGMDACMANLMRPALYGAYHHITVLGKEHEEHEMLCDVTGSLCENNDKFAIDRLLPEIERGDILAIHDAGAHGHAMGFNYNGKLRSAEILLRPDGSFVQIRRAESIDDYFTTLDLEGLKDFE
ncbi:MAG: diaminopimelate decarboxylase [Methanolobus sp.]